jgi:hypothetical protein
MAQTQQGLVNVTITDVSILNNFLNDTQIAALNNRQRSCDRAGADRRCGECVRYVRRGAWRRR